MDPHSLRVLEFPEVIELVAKRTHWPPGRELVEALRPAPSLAELRVRQADVAEAIRWLQEAPLLPLGGLDDVRDAIKLAGRGGGLDGVELLAIREVAVTSRRVGRALDERRPAFPRLARRADGLPTFPRLESEIGRCLSNDARVLDSASGRLRELRAEIRSLDGAIGRAVNTLLRDPDIQKMVQEPIVTQRMGRSVIPVKAEHRGKFPGLVIDQSSSGATVFMEPSIVLGLSNQLRTATMGEEKEVAAILQALSGWVSQDCERLQTVCVELADLDLVMAQADWGQRTDGNLPDVDVNLPLRLVAARHPLLLAHGITPIPIDMQLGAELRTLVVTGPNTGGKTVALKTAGLFTALAMCGLPIPAKVGSTLPFIDQVWADIGDEQSIEQSLSTFSSHLKQILRILPQARHGSLLLLDEVGAGTDPSEGAALGIALLEHFTRSGALSMVTTHLSDLKVYASKTEGVENAAVEFDASTLSPTYRVLMGIPGRSNALLIASRLGLPDALLRRSRELLGQDYQGVEGLLDELEAERTAVRALEGRLSEGEQRVANLRTTYENKLAVAEAEKQRLLQAAAQTADGLVNEARNRAHGLLRDYRERLAVLERQRQRSLDEARDYLAKLRDEDVVVTERLPLDAPYEELSLDDLEKLTRPEEEDSFDEVRVFEAPAMPGLDDEVDTAVRIAARTVESELQQLELAPFRAPELPPRLPGPELAVGSPVYSRRFGKDGELLAIRGDKADVKFGAVRLSLPLDDLTPSTRPQESAPQSVSTPSSGRSSATGRVDLRGKNVDEAIYELDREIDQGALANLDKLEVIHGKGTGALRKGIQQHLKSHPLVVDQRLGEAFEGGWGVTVVQLRKP
jgi:DNA mismatch repair protein MutS2